MSTAGPRVVCVGDVMVDVVARLSGPLVPASDAPGRISTSGGGAAANVASWLALQGVPTTFVGRVGDDAFGRQSCHELERHGVDLAVTIDPSRPTGTCVVLVGPDGERTMVPDRGANDGGGDGNAHRTLLDRADALYLSGYALLGAASRSSALEILATFRATRRERILMVDAASAGPLSAASGFLADIGGDVLLLANADEATVLTGCPEPERSVRILGARCGAAVVKAGAAGAVWSDGTTLMSVPAVHAELVDSTGAGDAFAAGFLAACLAAADVASALGAGAALAARAVSRPGARPVPDDRTLPP